MSRRSQQPPPDVAGTSVSYLAEVRDSVPPVSDRSPVWLRQGRVTSGPPALSPQRHPCYELGLQLSGTGTELVGREQMTRGPGSLLLAAPGVPHWIEITDYPLDFITVFFVPSVLIDLGPDGDGLEILRRFTSPQTIRERLLHLTPAIRARMEQKFHELAREFEQRQFGRDVRLRTLLLDILVEFIRWERETGRQIAGSELPIEWQRVHKVLAFLQTHFKRPIYAQEVAAAAGVTGPQLKRLFRAALGMTWGRYLQQYRIHRAAVLLGEPGGGVLETALEVGFETMSHFNATFRKNMGVSPRQYRQHVAERANSVPAKADPPPAARKSASRRAKNRR